MYSVTSPDHTMIIYVKIELGGCHLLLRNRDRKYNGASPATVPSLDVVADFPNGDLDSLFGEHVLVIFDLHIAALWVDVHSHHAVQFAELVGDRLSVILGIDSLNRKQCSALSHKSRMDLAEPG